MYLGNSPALNYTSLATQTFTAVTGQTQYTLDHSVANGNDILLYISNVKQVEGNSNSYTATGNTLTLNTAISAGTEMYCLFVSVARESITPPNNSVGTSQLVDDAVTKDKVSNLMYPAFEASLSSDQTLSDAVEAKVQFDNEIFDSDNCYDATTNYRFLPTVAGKYFVYLKINFRGDGGINDTFTRIKKNGVNEIQDLNNDSAIVQQAQITMGVIDMNGTSDYIEGFVVNDVASGSGCSLDADVRKTTFGAYRIGD